jgi:LPXTG-motif cell wall-anchored protein
MTRRNNLWSTLRFAWEISVAVVGVGCFFYVAYKSAHKGEPNGRTWEIAYLLLGLMLLLTSIIRFLRRKRRNYFKEEIAHRRALVR